MLNNNFNIANLPEIPQKAVKDYQNKIDSLTAFVNDKLSNNENIDNLIGDNPIEKMFENHENHAYFMINVFLLNEYNLLISTIPWVYDTYINHGFSYDYFVVELKTWMQAVEKYLKPENASLINEIYSFMLENHQKFIETSKNENQNKIKIPDKYKKIYSSYVEGLIAGNHKICFQIIKEKVTSKNDVKNFFENILKPAMYKVGTKWENKDISVAEEHLASSIASRGLSTIYSKFATWDTSSKKATITAVANEFHEIGSRIIADSLEFEGWTVDHLGVNTPVPDLIDFLLEKKPFLVGLSVAVPFNLKNAVKTIEKIKFHPELKDIKIMIGGKVFNDVPDLWRKTGADAHAKNTDQAIKIAEKWWQSREV